MVLVAVLGPEPIVPVQGFGELLLTVMPVPLVTKLALAVHGNAAEAIASNATAHTLRGSGTRCGGELARFGFIVNCVVPE